MTTEDEVRAARRTVAIHRRRRYPDTTVCGLCGYRWLISVTATGTPVAGCLRRRRALELLDGAYQLDGRGRAYSVSPVGTPPHRWLAAGRRW